MNDLLSKYGFDEWSRNVVSCENSCRVSLQEMANDEVQHRKECNNCRIEIKK